MNISDLLKEANNGSLVLPDFQRSFIWEPEDVRELLVSVLGNYFIGSILVLNQLSEHAPFALRLIEGVEKVNENAKIQPVVKIVLDGQQRITALYYAICQPPINLKNRKAVYRFYLDVEKVLQNELYEGVFAVSSKDRKAISDIKNNPNVISFSLLLDIGEIAKKFQGHKDFNKIIELATKFMNYSVYTVDLQDSNLEKIVETFERINRTGEPLSLFELLTAKLYRNGIKLRELHKTALEKYKFTEVLPPDYILKAMSAIRGKETKRKNMLEIEATNFPGDWNAACEALEAAYVRIVDIKNGYGVMDFKKWMPYSTMIIPLAAMLHYLEITNNKLKKNFEKIDKWYWTAVFSNRYDQGVDSTTVADLESIKKWVQNDSIPDYILKFDPNIIELDADKQSSAIYRGVLSLVVLAGALDFKTGQAPQFDKEKIQDDHIFPKSLYDFHEITNRTLIATNSEKSNTKPSVYFGQKLKDYGRTKLMSILRTHLIDDDALSHLLKDELDSFVEKRKNAIIDEIKNKTI